MIKYTDKKAPFRVVGAEECNFSCSDTEKDSNGNPLLKFGYKDVDQPRVAFSGTQPKAIPTHKNWTPLLWTFDPHVLCNYGGCPETDCGTSQGQNQKEFGLGGNFTYVTPLMFFDPLQAIFLNNGILLHSFSFYNLDPPLKQQDCKSCVGTDGNTNNCKLNEKFSSGTQEQTVFSGFETIIMRDIFIEVEGLNATQPYLKDYSDWCCKGILYNNDNAESNEYFEATFMQGSPFSYFETNYQTINIYLRKGSFFWIHDNDHLNNIQTIVFTEPDAQSTYALFVPSNCAVSFEHSSASSLYVILKFSGTQESFFSIAKLPYQTLNKYFKVNQDIIINSKIPCYILGCPGTGNGTESFPSENNPDSPYGYFLKANTPFSDVPTYSLQLGLLSLASAYNQFFNQFDIQIYGTNLTPSSTLTFYKLYLYNLDNITNIIMQYREVAFNFPINTEISWEYSEEDSTVTSTFNITVQNKIGHLGSYDTLIALKPHQYKYLKEDVNFLTTENATLTSTNPDISDFTYNSARGTLKTIKGNTFQTVYNYHGFVPSFPDVLDPAQHSEIEQWIQELLYPTTGTKTMFEDFFPDAKKIQASYVEGKILNRLSQLLSLPPDTIGSIKGKIIDYIKTVLSDWFDPYVGTNLKPDLEYLYGTNVDNGPCFRMDYADLNINDGIGLQYRYLYYSNEWNTLIAFPADFGSSSEFNDHHFHYGYFIKTMAYMYLYGDQQWAESNQDIIELLIKDVANWDKNDTRFPFLRHFNVYAGHSFANGHLSDNSGGNQESSAEAMNFASALILWGNLIGDKNIRDTGIFLYTNELIGIQEYYFDIQDTNFPKNVFVNKADFPPIDDPQFSGHFYDFFPKFGCIVWDQKVDLQSFFGRNLNYLLGIQFLPITSSSLYLATLKNRLTELMDDSFVLFYNELIKTIDHIEDVAHMHSWFDIWTSVKAILNILPENYQIPVYYVEDSNISKQVNCNSVSEIDPDPFLLNSGTNNGCYDLGTETICFRRGEIGDTHAHTYYFVHTLQALGEVQTNFGATTSLYAVFQKGTRKRFLAFLPYSEGTNCKEIEFFNKNDPFERYCFYVTPGVLFDSENIDMQGDCEGTCQPSILPSPTPSPNISASPTTSPSNPLLPSPIISGCPTLFPSTSCINACPITIKPAPITFENTNPIEAGVCSRFTNQIQVVDVDGNPLRPLECTTNLVHFQNFLNFGQNESQAFIIYTGDIVVDAEINFGNRIDLIILSTCGSVTIRQSLSAQNIYVLAPKGCINLEEEANLTETSRNSGGITTGNIMLSAQNGIRYGGSTITTQNLILSNELSLNTRQLATITNRIICLPSLTGTNRSQIIIYLDNNNVYDENGDVLNNSSFPAGFNCSFSNPSLIAISIGSDIHGNPLDIEIRALGGSQHLILNKGFSMLGQNSLEYNVYFPQGLIIDSVENGDISITSSRNITAEGSGINIIGTGTTPLNSPGNITLEALCGINVNALLTYVNKASGINTISRNNAGKGKISIAAGTNIYVNSQSTGDSSATGINSRGEVFSGSVCVLCGGDIQIISGSVGENGISGINNWSNVGQIPEGTITDNTNNLSVIAVGNLCVNSGNTTGSNSTTGINSYSGKASIQNEIAVFAEQNISGNISVIAANITIISGSTREQSASGINTWGWYYGSPVSLVSSGAITILSGEVSDSSVSGINSFSANYNTGSVSVISSNSISITCSNLAGNYSASGINNWGGDGNDNVLIISTGAIEVNSEDAPGKGNAIGINSYNAGSSDNTSGKISVISSKLNVTCGLVGEDGSSGINSFDYSSVSPKDVLISSCGNIALNDTGTIETISITGQFITLITDKNILKNGQSIGTDFSILTTLGNSATPVSYLKENPCQEGTCSLPDVCSSPSNSPSPSISPSVSPSASPSLSPSTSPSALPGESPSISPSELPSVSPSTSPSALPGESPSISPSELPSVSPSTSPSALPGESPSISPSELPSVSPSTSPSALPGESPSISPSELPSVSPSISPSALPGESPSISPSVIPSISPSNTPQPAFQFLLLTIFLLIDTILLIILFITDDYYGYN